MDASTNDARSARSSTGYPVSIISGNTTTLAPRAAARRVHSTISSAFPSRSPTVALTWASAILSFVTLSSLGRSSLALAPGALVTLARTTRYPAPAPPRCPMRINLGNFNREVTPAGHTH